MREVRQPHGDQVGQDGRVPRLHRLPGVQEHQGLHPRGGREDRPRPGRDHRRGLRQVRQAHGGQARPLRAVPGVLRLPRVQELQAHLHRRRLPGVQGGLSHRTPRPPRRQDLLRVQPLP
ncbi:MAG TPA: hypothetical protein VFB81_07620 [Myxococcales bacterium]|nr:hypothetical protein [Myxococcales bacterium]